MDQREPSKSLRCRFGMHTWVTRSDAGARWQECGRCGKYSHRVDVQNRFPPTGMGDGAGGAT